MVARVFLINFFFNFFLNVEKPVGRASNATGASDISTCRTCNDGSYDKDGGASSCIECGPGKYDGKYDDVEVSGAGENPCKECSAGRYNVLRVLLVK